MLGPGARVRVHTTGERGYLDQRAEGTIERMSGDTLFLAQKIGGSREVYVGHPETQLFVFTGRSSSAGKGAAVGGILGLVAVGVVGMIAGKGCVGDRPLCTQRRPASLGLNAGLVVVGLGTGLVIGVVSSHDIWQRSPPPSEAVVASGGVHLGYSIVF